MGAIDWKGLRFCSDGTVSLTEGPSVEPVGDEARDLASIWKWLIRMHSDQELYMSRGEYWFALEYGQPDRRDTVVMFESLTRYKVRLAFVNLRSHTEELRFTKAPNAPWDLKVIVKSVLRKKMFDDHRGLKRMVEGLLAGEDASEHSMLPYLRLDTMELQRISRKTSGLRKVKLEDISFESVKHGIEVINGWVTC